MLSTLKLVNYYNIIKKEVSKSQDVNEVYMNIKPRDNELFYKLFEIAISEIEKK